VDLGAAADDCCYEVMDLEDAHKLRIITTAEVTDLLLGYFEAPRRDKIVENMLRVDDPNEQVAYLRSCVIGALVDRCAECFLANEASILKGDFQGSLLKNVSGTESEAYARCNELSMRKIYCASDVVDIELAGNRIITFLLEKLVDAVVRPELNYSRLLLSQVPLQYDVSAPTLYGKLQAVVDHVSAMTDVYALNLYRKLNGSTLPAV
ncbi:MAG: dehydrogenase, partial [Muribaculaceae bacterium]|nr:dehydrogenase [Muribaculaceae bacterium]